MKSFKTNPVSASELNQWNCRRTYNPRTKRKIKPSGKIYKYLEKIYLDNLFKNEPYHDFHGKKIDPLLKIKLPLKKNKPIFSYKYQWDPFTGERTTEDPRGPLYFDPDTLIYYFYTNRLNHLWIQENENYSGTYGDGVGKGELFEVVGRGHHPEWYLFRLPLPDGYTSKDSNQLITFGPKLTFNEIDEIFNLSLNYNNYFKRFGKKKPNLITFYNLYHDAIKKPDYENIEIFGKELIDQQYNQLNRSAVNKIKLL